MGAGGYPPAGVGTCGEGDADELCAAGVEGGGLGVEGEGCGAAEFLDEGLKGLCGVGDTVVCGEVGEGFELGGGEEFDLIGGFVGGGGRLGLEREFFSEDAFAEGAEFKFVE